MAGWLAALGQIHGLMLQIHDGLRVSDEALRALEGLSLVDGQVIRRVFAKLRHPTEQLLALAAD